MFKTFLQHRPNVLDVDPTLYKCYEMLCVYWVALQYTVPDVACMQIPYGRPGSDSPHPDLGLRTSSSGNLDSDG